MREFLKEKNLISQNFCLDKMRLTLARAGFSHSNRVGFSGYGHKFHADEIVPVDKRAFRDLKICEVIIFKFSFLI